MSFTYKAKGRKEVIYMWYRRSRIKEFDDNGCYSRCIRKIDYLVRFFNNYCNDKGFESEILILKEILQDEKEKNFYIFKSDNTFVTFLITKENFFYVTCKRGKALTKAKKFPWDVPTQNFYKLIGVKYETRICQSDNPKPVKRAKKLKPTTPTNEYQRDDKRKEVPTY